MNPPRPGAGHARDRARALSAFYSAGSLLILVSLLLPSWPGQDQGVLITVAVIAGITGACLVLGGARVGIWVCQSLVASGSTLIALCLLAGGGGAASATWSFFYVWVAIYSACFFTPPWAAAQVSLAAVLETLVLVQVGDGAQAPAQVTVGVGTTVAAAVVVGVLVSRVRDLAATDSLTGLSNRRSLHEALVTALAQAERAGTSVGALALDLNGFKAVNDTFGHSEGDRMLVEVARAWSSQLRQGDVLARTGGDEFVVVLPTATQESAEAVRNRLLAVTPMPLSASAGVALSAKGENPLTLLERADSSLYAVKPRHLQRDIPRQTARRSAFRV